MENVNRNVSVLEIQEKERCLYEWDFRIPTKGRISENIRSVPGNKYHFKDLKFKTGSLGEIEHSWDLRFDTDTFDVKLSYPESEELSIFVVGVELRLISKTATRSTHEFNCPEFKKEINSEDMSDWRSKCEWTATWSHQAALEKKRTETPTVTASSGILSLAKMRSNSVDLSSDQADFWTDAIDTVRICFTIEIERPGRCIGEAVYQPTGKAVPVDSNSVKLIPKS